MQPCQGVGTDSQSWVFSPAATGGTTDIKVFGDKCLDVTGGVDASGTKLQIYGCSTADKNQQWAVTTGDSGVENIQWANSTMCIDLTGGSQSASAPLQILTCQAGDNNQKWLTFDATFAPPAPLHTIVLVPASQNDTDRQLSLQATSPSANQPVILEFSDIDNQGMDWNYDGTVLSSFDGQFCLEVADGVDADGTKLQINICTGNAPQQWVIKPVSTSTIQWKDHNKCVDLTVVFARFRW